MFYIPNMSQYKCLYALKLVKFCKWRPMWTKFYQEHVIKNSIDHWWFAVMFDFFVSQFQCWSLFLLVTFVFKGNTGFFSFFWERDTDARLWSVLYIQCASKLIYFVFECPSTYMYVCVWLCILILWRDVKMYQKNEL